MFLSRSMIFGVRPSRLVFFFLLGAGCSSPTEPEPPPTLLVENPLCDGAGCKPIQVRAFVWEYEIPQPPIGLEVVGEITGPTACLELPDSWQISVSEVDYQGNTVEADTITSTLDDEIYLTVLDWDPLGDLALAMTETFIPGSSQGWSLALSEYPDPQGQRPFAARLTTSPRCSSE